MNITNVITQLKLVGVFGGRVAGAAEYAAAKDQGFLQTPAAYVIPIGEDASENTSANQTYQIITERIQIIVAFSNAVGVLSGDDRRGQTVSEQFEIVKFGIFKALLNWNPLNLNENPTLPDQTDPAIGHAIRGFRYMGGDLISYDLSRLYYSWIFGLDVTITEYDGWLLTGIPLEEIGFEIQNETTGEPTDILATGLITGLQDVDVEMLSKRTLEDPSPSVGQSAASGVGTFTITKT